MHAYDYEAVVYDGDVYCTECLPEGVDPDSEEVSPIFACDEWDAPGPACCDCATVHDYMALTE